MYMTHMCGGVYHTVQRSEDNLVKLVLSSFSEVPGVELRSSQYRKYPYLWSLSLDSITVFVS